jgi:anti-sigma regulatory factor (Ser/Thr protein kinase)
MTARLRRELRTVLALQLRRPEARALILLAVEEAVLNVLEHGYDGAPDRPVTVTVKALDDHRFRVRILDRAPERDVTRLPVVPLARSAHQAAVRGRGLAMVRLLTEAMSHCRRRGGGNRLELVFDADRLSRAVEEEFGEAA